MGVGRAGCRTGRLGLTLNEAKTSLRDARQERFDFLGYTFGPHIWRNNGRRYLGASPSRKSVPRLKDKIETRVVSGVSYPVNYTYNLADQVTRITYPSGRQVNYGRNAQGMINSVTTRQTSTAAVVNVATSITYRSMTRLMQSLTYGNGLTESNGWNLDNAQTLVRVQDGATNVINRTLARADNLNITQIADTGDAGEHG